MAAAIEEDHAMGEEEETTAAAAASPQISLNIMQTIRTAQMANGLKHGDYNRYRVYCARRLRSLYKSLRFLHGRGRYQKRKLDVAMVTDARWLMIPLVSAERAWAHAMQVKHENEDKRLGHRRHHCVRRLAKASMWAGELARFAAAVCDARGALEAQAYAAWMAGGLALEREADWARALALYTRARGLFGELAKVGDLDSRGLCAAMAEEVEQSVRYCDYQLQRAGGGGKGGGGGGKGAPDAADLLGALGATDSDTAARGLLQSKLAALQAEAQVQQSAATSAFEWRGQSHPVRHERVRVALHAAGELAAALGEASSAAAAAAATGDAMDVDGGRANTGSGGGGAGAGPADGLLAAHDRAINALAEARAAVKAQAKAAAAGEAGAAGEGGAAADELAALEKAIAGAVLDRTLARGEAQVAAAEARFEAAAALAAVGRKGGAARPERGAKPEDLLRVHEALMHHAEALGELASRLGGRAGEALADAAAARGAAYAAGRCYYVAHTYLAAGGCAAEACALFARCAERRVAEARERIEDLPKGEAEARAALPRLAALEAKARAWRLVAAAEAAAEAAAAGEDVRKGVAAMGLERGQPPSQQQRGAGAGGALADHLEAAAGGEGGGAWESFAGTGAGGKGARLCAVPYALQATPVRPIMLDTAAAGVAYPDISHRLRGKPAGDAGAQTSTFARLFGWGAAS